MLKSSKKTRNVLTPFFFWVCCKPYKNYYCDFPRLGGFFEIAENCISFPTELVVSWQAYIFVEKPFEALCENVKFINIKPTGCKGGRYE